MEFDVLAAFVAGFIATVVMTLMMKGSASAGMTKMPPMPLVTGTMITGDRDKATRAGAVIHFIVMGTIVFGIVYAALFVALGTASWVAGLVIGLVHGVIAGLAMAMMGSVHPRMTAPASPEGEAVVETPEGVTIVAPGLFAKNWGAMTPAGLLIGHAVYGIVLAVVYAAIV